MDEAWGSASYMHVGLWFGDSGDRDGAFFVNFPEIQPKDSFTFIETSMEPPKRL